MQEIWKSIGIKTYEVSNLGNVKGLSGRLIKQQIKSGICGGYSAITIRIDDNNIIKKTLAVHYLVMLVFIGERPQGMEIDHINNIRDDNRLQNLRYCTRSENIINRPYYRSDIGGSTQIEHNLLVRKDNQKKYRENRKLLSIYNI